MIAYVNTFILPAALALLPTYMDTPKARALMLAIMLQESEGRARFQILDGGRRGKANGLWQFEVGGGIAGVLTHPKTRPHIERVLEELGYLVPAASACHAAVEHNDPLAAAFARLNLWWLPHPLPARGDYAAGYAQYLEAWKPGKPKPAKWPANYQRAWNLVEGEL